MRNSMKKLILIFIALSFFSVCFAGSIQDMHKAAIARKNVAVGTTVFEEDFDACDTGTGLANCDETWVQGGSNSYNVTAAAGPDASNAMVYNDNSGELCYSVGHALGSGDFEITYDFKIVTASADSTTMYFKIYDDAGKNVVQVYMEWETGDDVKIQAYGHTEGFSVIVDNLNINTWYTATLKDFDFTGKTYDIYINARGGALDNFNDDREFYDVTGADLDNIYFDGASAVNTINIVFDNLKIVEY